MPSEYQSEPLRSIDVTRYQIWQESIVLILIKRFASDESGSTAIEYALIAGMIGCVIISALKGIGSKLNVKFGNISSSLN